jgi:hypothetical protein
VPYVQGLKRGPKGGKNRALLRVCGSDSATFGHELGAPRVRGSPDRGARHVCSAFVGRSDERGRTYPKPCTYPSSPSSTPPTTPSQSVLVDRKWSYPADQ